LASGSKIQLTTMQREKAFIMNRIGDLGFLLGIILIFVTYGSISYGDVFAKAGVSGEGVSNLHSFIIIYWRHG